MRLCGFYNEPPAAELTPSAGASSDILLDEAVKRQMRARNPRPTGTTLENGVLHAIPLSTV